MTGDYLTDETARIETAILSSLPSASIASVQLANADGFDHKDYEGKVDGGGFKGVMVHPKTPFELISPVFLDGIAQVLLHGAKKYARNNWMRGMSWTTVFGSILRHLFDWFRGKKVDSDSGLPVLFHAACELMFLIHFTEVPKYEQFDDRVFKESE